MSASAYIYASPYMLADSLGLTDETQRETFLIDNLLRMNASLIAGSRYVDYKVGNDVVETDQTAPYEPVQVACPPAWSIAAVAAAVRFYRSAEATFGVIGLNEAGGSVYARASFPEVDLILFGHRVSWGIG